MNIYVVRSIFSSRFRNSIRWNFRYEISNFYTQKMANVTSIIYRQLLNEVRTQIRVAVPFDRRISIEYTSCVYGI